MPEGGNARKSVTANISGSFLDLPAGPVGFASGVKLRRESGWRNPDSLTVLGVANTNRQYPISGETTAKEVFAEFAVPIVARKPFAKSLFVNAAGRYSNYVGVIGQQFLVTPDHPTVSASGRVHAVANGLPSHRFHGQQAEP